MEKETISSESELHSRISGVHKLVKTMNNKTRYPETNIRLADKQKTDAKAMLKAVTHGIRQLKGTVRHHQEAVSTPSMNTKQNKMEEFMASFETPPMTETVSKATATASSTSGINSRLTTLTEMAKWWQEKESRLLRDLDAMVDLLEDLSHSVAFASALDRLVLCLSVFLFPGRGI
ncbi:uncharacterized protein LOC121390719 [Gigantopelta aegis]|uniref:uncharacterized protein LOC121390719 n=1 Tax=Gigantopelta aegis TaxID=1735272 RepID=UPI001B889D74|nr:uncharacterized protein LOC121390719 [Gigantopelta aegis]